MNSPEHGRLRIELPTPGAPVMSSMISAFALDVLDFGFVH
jgi:hypothetical protein